MDEKLFPMLQILSITQNEQKRQNKKKIFFWKQLPEEFAFESKSGHDQASVSFYVSCQRCLN